MGVLDGFSPGQRQAAMIGVPIVAGLGLVSALRKKATAPGVVAPGAGAATPTTDAIGVGQLTDFESQLSDSFAQLAWSLQMTPATSPAPDPTPTPAAQPDTTSSAPPPPSSPAPAPLAPGPAIQLYEGQVLPPATGVGHTYITPDGYEFSYG